MVDQLLKVLSAGALPSNLKGPFADHSGLYCMHHFTRVCCHSIPSLLFWPALLATASPPLCASTTCSRSRWSAVAASADAVGCPSTADKKSGPAVHAACAARRWLARNAARIPGIRSKSAYSALECASLVSYLPALERAELILAGSRTGDELGCLLEVLAWCPLRVLDLHIHGLKQDTEGGDEQVDPPQPFPAAPAFAKLRSLTKLVLYFHKDGHHVLADVVGAVVSVTCLEELSMTFPYPAVVPAALGQLRSLQALRFSRLSPSVLKAGCLDLPNLLSLEFKYCIIKCAEVLLGATALQSLTSITSSEGNEPPFVAQVLQLPQLQRMVVQTVQPRPGIASLVLARLPADMALLSSVLQCLNMKGLRLTQFPLALTQLVALECLQASMNEFADLPAGITALSRLTELELGRFPSSTDPLQLHEKRPLDARAVGDLSAFPALRWLTFKFCEVMLCESLLGAVRHASLVSLTLLGAHPAPESALAVLELGKVLRHLRQGRVLRCSGEGLVAGKFIEPFLQEAQGRAPFQQFIAAMAACGL